MFGLYEAVTATDAQFIQTDRVRGPGEPWRRFDPGDLATVLPNLNLIGAASAVDGIHPLSGCSSLFALTVIDSIIIIRSRTFSLA